MADSPRPATRPETRRRQYLLLSLGTAAVQGLILLLSLPGFGLASLIPALGLVLTLVLAGLVWRPTTTQALFSHAVLGSGNLWILAGLVVHLTTDRAPLSTQLISSLGLGVLAYAWFPFRVATSWTLVGALPVLAAGLTRPAEVPSMLQGALALLIVAVTSRSGRRLMQERERVEWLQNLAFRDPLTGLHNRRAPLDELERLLALRPVPGDVAVVIFDLDHFKRINDTFGHLRGDDVLIYVAALLTRQLPEGTLLCRWGGEEFLALLYGQEPAQAQRRVAEVLADVRRIQIKGLDGLSMSAGGALLREAADVRTLLTLADRRLYAAKDAGRDRAHWGPDVAVSR